MSGPESFSASESQNQGSTAESFRLFQQRMKIAGAQMAAIRKGESKQKKKEDHLAKILTDFIKNSQDDLLIEHLSKLLSINLPAIFILSLLILNYPDLQEQSGLKLLEYSTALHAGALENQTLPDLYHQNHLLPLEVKIALDSWIQEISQAIQSNPIKTTDHALRLDQKVKPEIINLAAHILNAYLQSKGLTMQPEANHQFLEICLNGIFQTHKKHLIE